MKRYTAISETESIGIFHILGFLEQVEMTLPDARDLEYAERKLNLELPIPPYPDNVKTEAWFTDYGAEYFREPLEILGNLIDKYLDMFGYSFQETQSENIGRNTMYKDKYQIIFCVDHTAKE